jgi:hypothetical protein
MPEQKLFSQLPTKETTSARRIDFFFKTLPFLPSFGTGCELGRDFQ